MAFSRYLKFLSTLPLVFLVLAVTVGVTAVNASGSSSSDATPTPAPCSSATTITSSDGTSSATSSSSSDTTSTKSSSHKKSKSSHKKKSHKKSKSSSHKKKKTASTSTDTGSDTSTVATSSTQDDSQDATSCATTAATVTASSSDTSATTDTNNDTPAPTDNSVDTPAPTDSSTDTPTPTPTPSSVPPQPITSGTVMQNYPASDGQIMWRGDWEEGGTAPWGLDVGDNGGTHWGNSSVEVVTNPVRQGKYAAKLTVNPQSGSDNERAELSSTQADTGGYPDQEWYYSWSIYIPSVPNKATGWADWTDTMQWMDLRYQCSPPEQILIRPAQNGQPEHFALVQNINDQVNCDGNDVDYPLTNVVYDQWIDFTAHIKFSKDPNVGFIEIWVDGQHVLPLTHMQTIEINGKGVYMEQELYRSHMNGPNVIYVDATRRHTEYGGDPFFPSAGSTSATPTPLAAQTTMSTQTSMSSTLALTARTKQTTPAASGNETEWGMGKNRIIRPSNSDILTIFSSAGMNDERKWYGMHLASGS